MNNIDQLASCSLRCLEWP